MNQKKQQPVRTPPSCLLVLLRILVHQLPLRSLVFLLLRVSIELLIIKKIELITTHLFTEIKEIKIKGNALRECLNHDDKINDNDQKRPIFVKVKVSQERPICTTKDLNLYDLDRESDIEHPIIIMGSNLSSCQNSSLDLNLPNIEIELQFSRTYLPGVVSVESL